MSKVRGFTLIELVAVLVIAAILAITAAAVLNPRDFDTARFANEVLAQISYAQKVAVAARRNVTVTVAGNAISLTMCTDTACSATVAVPSPQGEASFVRAAPAGVTVNATTSPFTFDALGSTAAQVTLTFTGNVVRTLTVEAVTGYAHP